MNIFGSFFKKAEAEPAPVADKVPVKAPADLTKANAQKTQPSNNLVNPNQVSHNLTNQGTGQNPMENKPDSAQKKAPKAKANNMFAGMKRKNKKPEETQDQEEASNNQQNNISNPFGNPHNVASNPTDNTISNDTTSSFQQFKTPEPDNQNPSDPEPKKPKFSFLKKKKEDSQENNNDISPNKAVQPPTEEPPKKPKFGFMSKKNKEQANTDVNEQEQVNNTSNNEIQKQEATATISVDNTNDLSTYNNTIELEKPKKKGFGFIKKKQTPTETDQQVSQANTENVSSEIQDSQNLQNNTENISKGNESSEVITEDLLDMMNSVSPDDNTQTSSAHKNYLDDFLMEDGLLNNNETLDSMAFQRKEDLSNDNIKNDLLMGHDGEYQDRDISSGLRQKLDSISKRNIDEAKKEQTYNNQESQFDPDRKLNEIERDRVDLLARLFRIMVSQNTFSRKFDSLESEIVGLQSERNVILLKQDTAISQEDYVNAENYENKIKEIDERVVIFKDNKEEITKEIEELDNNGIEIIENEKRQLELAERGIRSLIKELKETRDSYESSEKVRLKHEKGYLNDEKEQINISKNHNDVNLENIEQEQLAVEKGIEKQTMNYIEDLKEAQIKKDELEIRIEELMKELNFKKHELSSVNEEIEISENKIQEVRSKFSKQLNRVENKKEKIQDEAKICNKELEEIIKKIEKVEEFEQNFITRLERYDKKEDRFRDLLKFLNEESNITRKNVIKKEKLMRELFDRKFHFENDLESQETFRKSGQSGLDEAKRIEFDLENLASESHQIEESIPILDKEKRYAVSSRNFKDANEKSKLIKNKQQRQEDIINEISELNARKEQLHRELGDGFKDTEKDQEKKMLFNQEKYYIIVYQVLKIKLAEIERILENVTRDSEKKDLYNSFGLEVKQIKDESNWLLQKLKEIETIYETNFDKKINEDSENLLKPVEIQTATNDIQDMQDLEERPQGDEDLLGGIIENGLDLLEDTKVQENVDLLGEQEIELEEPIISEEEMARLQKQEQERKEQEENEKIRLQMEQEERLEQEMIEKIRLQKEEDERLEKEAILKKKQRIEEIRTQLKNHVTKKADQDNDVNYFASSEMYVEADECQTQIDEIEKAEESLKNELETLQDDPVGEPIISEEEMGRIQQEEEVKMRLVAEEALKLENELEILQDDVVEEPIISEEEERIRIQQEEEEEKARLEAGQKKGQRIQDIKTELAGQVFEKKHQESQIEMSSCAENHEATWEYRKELAILEKTTETLKDELQTLQNEIF